MAFDNLDQFNAALQKASDQLTQKQWPVFYMKVALDLLSGVVLKTPVGNPDLWASNPPLGYVGGFARANWQTAINGFTNEETVNRSDRSGSSTIRKGASELNFRVAANPFASIHLFNNAPYIERLEDGWSSQAPSGMVALTMAEIQSGLPTGGSS